MPRPIITYAPPAHHGVTTLMAVGKDEDPGPGQAVYFNVGRAAKYAVIGGAIGMVRGGRRTTSYALMAAGLSLIANAFGR